MEKMEDSFREKEVGFACSSWIVIGWLDLLSSFVQIAAMFIVPPTPFELEDRGSVILKVCLSIPLCTLAIILGFAARKGRAWAFGGLETYSWVGALACVAAAVYMMFYMMEVHDQGFPHQVSGVFGTLLSLVGIALMIYSGFIFNRERRRMRRLALGPA